MSDPVLQALLYSVPPTVASIAAVVLALINRGQLDRANARLLATKIAVDQTQVDTNKIADHVLQTKAAVDETQSHTLELRSEMNGKFEKLQSRLLGVTGDAEYARGILEGGRDQRDVRDAKALELDHQNDTAKITGPKKE
jgi:hypothetical protein